MALSYGNNGKFARNSHIYHQKRDNGGRAAQRGGRENILEFPAGGDEGENATPDEAHWDWPLNSTTLVG
jgi:hypothetical protein